MAIWSQLPRELELRILSFLEPNEVAGSMRLVCKAAAVLLPGPRRTVIRLSQPVPPHAFTHRWGRPGAMRSLSYKNRMQILRLTAASGSIANLDFLLPRAGCLLTGEVLAAAAAAGQLAMCQWLRQRGCPWSMAETDDPGCAPWSRFLSVAKAAGGAGSREVCEWLIAAGCPDAAADAAFGAAGGGHVGLVEWLLPHIDATHLRVLRCHLAEGCDLATLQRLHCMAPGGLAGELGFGRENESMVDAAAGSPTPDWREKVEWLEAAGYPRGTHAFISASNRPDALERITWLRARGFTLNWYVFVFVRMSWVTSLADLEALEGLMQQGGASRLAGILVSSVARSAAERGNLEVLKALHERGQIGDEVIHMAAQHGHLHVVAWAVEAGAAALSSWWFSSPAASGSVELMAWLQDRGFTWESNAYASAAEAGCEEALEWLAANGCPMEGAGGAYAAACHNGDLATLACLRRLGCPLTADDFTHAIKFYSCPLAALRWLVDNGCPVDWAAALEVAPSHYGAASDVVAWLEEGRRQQAAAAGPAQGGSGV